jgi:pimeloyl-ACP methyl ester carboxylesterase
LGNAVLLECRNRLIGEGVNLAAYNSAENAADLNDLRLALGIDKWNLYGISYGTRLALTAMRDFPEGLRSVVIDSVVPLQSNLYAELPANGARAFGALFDACAADATCGVDFPDLRAVFFDLVDRLDENPMTFPVKLQSGQETEMLLNGDGFMGIVFQSLYATPVIPYLPRLIDEVRDGNYSLAAALQSAFLEQLEHVSFGMHYSVQCEEEAPFGTLDDLRASVAQYPEYSLFAGTGIFDLCRAWGTPAAEPVENQPVTSDVPTLVLSGQLDPITPPSWGELAAQTLSNGFYFELPNAGHGASLTGGDCPRDLVLEFFGDPASRPDATCLTSEMTRIVYARPLDRLEVKLAPFALDSMGFGGVAPEDWIEVGPGIHTPDGSLTDQTAILQQSAPVPAETFLRLLATQIEQSGAQVEFKEIGSRSRNGLDWTIYSAEVSIAALDLAMAESGGTTYLILLQSVVDERDVLYDLLFLPAVDALRPAGR